MFIGMQQLWDEYEREKLARETKRGMREATEQGFRTGGRAPDGYRRELHALPDGHKG
jgi:DNA invertase Pin-like site-specific DNA recombinase